MDRGKVENARNREGKPKTKVFISESDDKIEWEDRGDARAKLAMKGIAQSTEMAPIPAAGPMAQLLQKEPPEKIHKQKSFGQESKHFQWAPQMRWRNGRSNNIR